MIVLTQRTLDTTANVTSTVFQGLKLTHAHGMFALQNERTTIFVTLVGTVVIFSVPSMWVFACWHHRGKKFSTGRVGAILLATILVTNLETCAFCLPQCWFGHCHLSAPRYMWLNIGKEKGYIWVRTTVWRLKLRNFWENSRKTVSVSTICDEYRRHTLC